MNTYGIAVFELANLNPLNILTFMSSPAVNGISGFNIIVFLSSVRFILK